MTSFIISLCTLCFNLGVLYYVLKTNKKIKEAREEMERIDNLFNLNKK